MSRNLLPVARDQNKNGGVLPFHLTKLHVFEARIGSSGDGFQRWTPSLFPIFSYLCCDRYVEGMRKRKLQGGKQDIAGTKQEDPRTKDWIVELNAASRALALRWLRAAREGIDGKRSCRLPVTRFALVAGVKQRSLPSPKKHF